MPPCIRTHCPSHKHSCQRYPCTLELRNRLERHRAERDQLKAKLEADATTSTNALRKLKEDCSKIDRNSLSWVKQQYEDQTSEKVRRLGCFCAECAVEHEDWEIGFLRRRYRVLQTVQRVVADVERQKKCRERNKGMSSSPHADAWKKHADHAAVQPNGVNVIGRGIMECLPVQDLLDMGVTIERVVIPGRRACR